jgi:4-hydroxy-tetrahydrodipicolinate reductase
MTRIAVLGANGRMGQAVTRLVLADPGLKLRGATTEPGHATLGQDAGVLAGRGTTGVRLTDDLAGALADCQVAVDFTAPAAAATHAAACAQAGCALVMGTTGLGDGERQALAEAARRVPVVYSRNMSLGITVLTALARQAAALLGPEFDIEIVEAHHRHKKDAPSGTALQLGEAVAEARGRRLADVAVYTRHGLGDERPREAIGFATVRAGAIVGDHSVLLVGEEETLELRHHAADRALFARGALRAATWAVGRSPGLYTMADVLGL